MTPTSSPRLCLAVAAIAGLAAVGADALGAHALGSPPDPVRLRLLDLATRYALIHAATLVAIAALIGAAPHRWLRAAAWAIAIGLVVFCGGVGAHGLTGTNPWPKLVPFGGLAFLIGWSCLLIGAVRWPRPLS